MLASLLETRGVGRAVCADEASLGTVLEEALPGALLVTQEALTEATVALIRRHLDRQPEWSELSIIVIVESDAVRSNLPQRLAERWPGSRQVFYQRPLTAIELVSGVQSALLARLRQRDVRDHLRLERELRHELNHRVKNILASVNSIFQMSARNSADVDELKANFGGRLTALGSVHAALFEAGGEALDLEKLISLVLAPYTGDGGTSFRLEGDGIALNKDATAAFGLVVHELATNATKYGAWSVPDGEIHVRWRVEGGRFCFEWRESGGPRPEQSGRSGYGTRYIRTALQGQLGEPPEIDLTPQGLRLRATGDVDRVETTQSPDRSPARAVDPVR